MIKINVCNLDKLYSLISQEFPLFLPIERGEEVNYSLWDKDSKVSLFTLKTVKSAKDCFFPQSQDLAEFYKEDEKIKISPCKVIEKPFVVMGVRACDYNALKLCDEVFLSQPKDTLYQSARENGIIITLACDRPDESCFCNVFGIDLADPKGDVTTWHIGDDIYWRSNTPKGDIITEKVKDLFDEAQINLVEFQQKFARETIKKLPLANLDLSTFKNSSLKEIFESKKWQKLSEACIGCGSCTFVCPTCTCFDIKDFKANGKVIRYRCWDSCMYADFTKMAGGQPRPTQKERFRQRFMHKLVYYPMEHEGKFSCVGCGRCVKKCPQNLNIAKVIKNFGGKA